jgi:hypothetical protein
MVTKMPPSAISTPIASGADPITSMLASRSMKALVATGPLLNVRHTCIFSNG